MFFIKAIQRKFFNGIHSVCHCEKDNYFKSSIGFCVKEKDFIKKYYNIIKPLFLFSICSQSWSSTAVVIVSCVLSTIGWTALRIVTVINLHSKDYVMFIRKHDKYH